MRAASVLVSCLVIATMVNACASREQLVTRSAAVPDGIDLSGHWILRPDDEETVERIKQAELAAAGGLESIVATSGTTRSSSNRATRSGALVHVFLETGKALKVTQTDDGIFISFDRSVVEEYRYGENRVISVGPVEADRASGWNGRNYVIETLDPDGVKLTETYRLIDNSNALLRSIEIRDGSKEQLAIKQVFDRE